MKYILFFYSLALALFIGISGFLGTKKPENMTIQLIFLPVVLYFFIKALRVLRKKESLDGRLGKEAMFFSILILTILIGINIKRVFFENKTVSLTPIQTTVPTSNPSPTPKEILKKVKIVIEDKSPSVNIRKKATIYSEILKKVEAGNIFEFVEEEKEWFKIKLDEKVFGYVAKKYARLTQDE